MFSVNLAFQDSFLMCSYLLKKKIGYFNGPHWFVSLIIEQEEGNRVNELDRYLSKLRDYLIRIHKNLMQHLINNISIFTKCNKLKSFRF